MVKPLVTTRIEIALVMLKVVDEYLGWHRGWLQCSRLKVVFW
jgi:hypothetical protein